MNESENKSLGQSQEENKYNPGQLEVIKITGSLIESLRRNGVDEQVITQLLIYSRLSISVLGFINKENHNIILADLDDLIKKNDVFNKYIIDNAHMFHKNKDMIN